jgi:hypothetical protein
VIYAAFAHVSSTSVRQGNFPIWVFVFSRNFFPPDFQGFFWDFLVPCEVIERRPADRVFGFTNPELSMISMIYER